MIVHGISHLEVRVSKLFLDVDDEAWRPLLFGDEDHQAKLTRDAGLRNVHWSPSVADAVQKLPVKVKSRDVVLFKASRAMALERVYDAVKGGIEQRRRTTVERSGD